MSVCPCSAWPGSFRGHHTSIPAIDESVGDEKRVTANLFDLLFGQIIGVSLFGRAGYQFHADRFIQYQVIPVGIQPFNQWVCARGSWAWENDFFTYFLRYLHSI